MTSFVNKPKKGDHEYAAGLNGQEILFYAANLYDAKEYAIKYFKPKKKNLGLVWVHLYTAPVAVTS